MVRLSLALLTALCIACGGDVDLELEEPTPGSSDEELSDGAPMLESVQVLPENPTAADPLSVVVRASDPDQDHLTVEISWFRNGALFDDSGRESTLPFEFDRGDLVYASVTVSDGEFEVEGSSDPVRFVNFVPRVTSIEITPREATATDMLTAEVQSSDADEDPVRYAYRWMIDGEPVPGADNSRLSPGKATRGAEVVVEVRASDPDASGEWVASQPFLMGNAAPEITTQPVYSLASSGTYEYAVKAKDPDGDAPLKYELIEGPAGMSVDIADGIVRWSVPPDGDGTHPVELSVSDPYGARTLQRYSLEVSWQVTTEDPDESSKERPASAQPGDELDSDELDETDGDDRDDEFEEPAASDFEDDFGDDDDL
jgi:hypothetical protein